MITDLQIDSYIACNHTQLGGYTLAMFIDGDYVCPSCAGRMSYTDRQYTDGTIDVYYEGPDLTCDCGAILESAYGDPELEEALAGPWIPDD